MISNKEKKLIEEIKNHVNSFAPGLFYMLDLLCRRLSGGSCFELLLDNPEAFRNLMIEIYNSSSAVETIAKVFLQPIAKISPNKSVDELIELFLNNPRELRRILQEILQCMK